LTWADDINAPGAKERLSTSSQDDAGTVRQLPSTLLEQAIRVAGRMSLDEYTLARVISSENGSGPAAHLLCIGDADLERARRRGISVFDHATGGTGRYGSQKAPRPVATSRDPYVRQLRAVRLLLQPGGARGIAKGATQYFDPRAQLSLWRDGRASHPLVILDRWTFDRPWLTRTRDDDGRRVDTLGPPGSDQLEWIGPIPGVNAWELILLRRKTGDATQRANYEAARAIIERGAAAVGAGTLSGAAAPNDTRERLALAVAGVGVAVGLKAL
jgi:hypothetical protein